VCNFLRCLPFRLPSCNETWGYQEYRLVGCDAGRILSYPTFQLLVTADVVTMSLILSTLIMEAIRSSETSVLTRATQRHIPEDGILHSHRLENLKSYIALTVWAL
jgi:hypothetical protein